MAIIKNMAGVYLDTEWLPIVRYNFVRFEGATDSQVRYGLDDPRDVLEEGEVYEVDQYIVYEDRSHVILEDYPECTFNSVCFQGVFGGEPNLPDVPACEVCGDRLELASTNGRFGGVVFACPSVEYISGGERERGHYEKSRKEFPDVKSAHICALRQEIRRLHGKNIT